MMRRGLLPFVLLLVSGTATAEVNVSGYLKSYALAQQPVKVVGTGKKSYHSQNSLRLMIDGFGNNINWQVHYELSPVFNSAGQVLDNRTLGRAGGTWRLTDIEDDLNDPSDKNRMLQNLDRLNVQFTLPNADLTIGRQAIAFGAARAIKPADVFLPFDVRVFSREYRVGVDAIRYQRPFGSLGEIDAGVILGDDASGETSAAFVQVKANTRGNDLSFVAMRFGDLTLGGVGLRRAFGPLGFWFEAAQASGAQRYWRATTGVDVALTQDAVGMIEFHYNGAGSADHRDYLTLVNTRAYGEGGVYLVGTRYLMPSVRWTLSPVLSIDAQSAYNLDDDSVFFGASLEFNMLENLYLDLGYYHYGGAELSTTRRGLPRVNSEFGTIPDLAFLSARYYY